jgi:hypothetical protein
MSGSGTATTATSTDASQTSTTLVLAMLETARHIGAAREGTATGGSTTTLVDTSLDEAAELYKGGTLWMLSGNNEGLCDVISAFSENTVTITDTLTNAILDGDAYAVSSKEYPKHKLKQAVLSCLRFHPVLKTDDSLTVTADTEEYSLPSGVSNIKRVEIAAEAGTPYSFAANLFWKEWNGKLVFQPGKEPGEAGRSMRLWYMGEHGEIEESGTILSSVDMNWLKWAAAAFLYRDQVKRIQKDNPTNLELMNEAKTQEARARLMAKRSKLSNMPSDPKLSGW